MAQVRSPNTPLGLLSLILRKGDRFLLDLVFRLDHVFTYIISRTRRVGLFYPYSYLYSLLARSMCKLGFDEPGRMFDSFMDFLERCEGEVAGFDSESEWEGFFEEFFGVSLVDDVDSVVSGREFFSQVREFVVSDDEGVLAGCVFGVLSEFGFPCPIVFYSVDDLMKPKRKVIDACFVPSGECGDLDYFLEVSVERFGRSDDYTRLIGFLNGLRGRVYSCRGDRCIGRQRCELMDELYSRLRSFLLG